jgi:hypothetical protein
MQISGFSSFTSLAVLSMGSNRLGEAASFELPSLAGLLGADAGNGPDAAKGTLQVPHKSVMFPMLQVLRLQDNSIRNIQGLQLYGFGGEMMWLSGALLCLCQVHCCASTSKSCCWLRACHE